MPFDQKVFSGADVLITGGLGFIGSSLARCLVSLDAKVTLNDNGQYELIPFPADQKAIDIGDYYGDFSKIQNALGWSPEIPLENGLSGTLAYYREHHAHYWNSKT